MTINRTLSAALLCGSVVIAVPALAQVGAAGSVVGGAGAAVSGAAGNLNGAADGATTIRPQAGTPPIFPSGDAAANGNVSGAVITPESRPALDAASSRAEGAINNASERGQQTLSNVPNANASASGQANAQAGVSGQNIQSGAGASASADSSGSSRVTLGQATKARSASAERAATKELNNAQASGMMNASVSGSSLNASGSSSSNIRPPVVP